MSAVQTEEPKATHKMPVIKTDAVKINNVGVLWKEVHVQAPADLSPQDLNSHPEVWRNVQSVAQIALLRYDRVLITGDGWMVDGIVVEADAKSAVLAFGRVMQLRTRSGSSWTSEDGRWSIRFSGNGYQVYRDDGVMASPSTFPNIESARGWLQSKHGPMNGAA